MRVKPIRSPKDYQRALAAAEALMPKTDQNSIDELEVLQVLIDRWERDRYSFPAVTPGEAIKFRMEQLDLKPRDLIPYLGTKSRVSEILAGLRQPTVDQIRALNRHLGVPLESLIGVTKLEPPRRASTASKAAIDKLRTLGVMKPGEPIDDFLERAQKSAPSALGMLRKSRTERTNAKTDIGALEAWCAGVLVKAEEQELPRKKSQKTSVALARTVAQLSAEPNAPALVRDALARAGVIFVTLDHLPGTYLDGAAICRGDGAPVIALTLRHDRLDNFWFTLLHEIAHVSEHLGDGTTLILDDLEVNTSGGIEEEADKFARNALIPPEISKQLADPELSTETLFEIARDARVHPAIVAGRWQWEHGEYRRFSKLLGRGEVRKHFKGNV